MDSSLYRSCLALFECYSSNLQCDIDEYTQRKRRLKIPIAPLPVVESLLSASQKIVEEQPPILSFNKPVVIVGDLNGNLPDLLQILKKVGLPPMKTYLFLGNIGGSGEFSAETLVLVLAMQQLWPTSVYFIRGSNEFKDSQPVAKLCLQMEEFHVSHELLNRMFSWFSQLPFAALCGQVLCIHGGIGPSIVSSEAIKEFKRPLTSMNSQDLVDFWLSDVIETLPMFLPSRKGDGCLFGAQALKNFLDKSHVKCLVRSHQFNPDGLKKYFDESLYSLWSCSTPENQGGKYSILNIWGEQIEEISLPSLDLLNRSCTVGLESMCENEYDATQRVSLPLNCLRAHTNIHLSLDSFTKTSRSKSITPVRKGSLNSKPESNLSKACNEHSKGRHSSLRRLSGTFMTLDMDGGADSSILNE